MSNTGWRADVIEQLESYEAPAAGATGTVDVTKVVSLLSAGTSGTQDLWTMADAQVRQIKMIKLIAGTDTLRVTPANLKNGTYVDFFAAGDYAVFEFDGVEWEVIYLGRGATLT
jgi:hypothetical protein